MRNIFGNIFRRLRPASGGGIRGRVHRISRVAGGDVSVIIRFGIEEPGALRLMQGAIIELYDTVDATAPPASLSGSAEPKGDAGAAARAEPTAALSPDPCTCGTTNGHPHEPDCPWWDSQNTATGYPTRMPPG